MAAPGSALERVDGVVLTQADQVDGRVHATFCTHGGRGAETTWLEITAPADAAPARLLDRLHGNGWRILPGTLLLTSPATTVREERDSYGHVTSWTSEPLGYDEIVIPLHPVDEDGTVLPGGSGEVKAARAALRHFGLNRAPIVTQTWRDLI